MKGKFLKAICLAMAIAVAAPAVTPPAQVSAATASYDHVFLKSKSGKIYYYVKNAPVKGEQVIDGYRYYFDITTGAMQTGWIQTGGKTKYAVSSGRLYTNTTTTINGKSYKFDAEGAVINSTSSVVPVSSGGITKTSRVTSVNPPATAYLRNGFYTTNGKTYYYMSGKLVKGLKQIGKYTYYFDKNGVMAVNKSVKVKGKTYYFDSKGYRVKSKKAIAKVKKAIKKTKAKETAKQTTSKKTTTKTTIKSQKTIKVSKEEIYRNSKGAITGRILSIPYIMQGGGVWTRKKGQFVLGEKYTNYGIVSGHTVATNGCGISSCAMAISALTGELVLPNKLASVKCGFNGRGSDGNVAKKAAAKYGLHAKVFKNLTKKELIEHLLKGHYVVVGVNRSCFGGGGDRSGGNSATGGAHFVLIHGYKDEKFAIADPNNAAQTYVYSKTMKSYKSFNNYLGNFAGVDSKGRIGTWNYGAIWK